MLWLVPAAIFFAAFRDDWKTTWNSLGVYSIAPPFVDLRSVPAALHTMQQGVNPLIANPFDTLHRPFNYPKVWLYAFSVLGINQENVSIAGIVVCALYLLCISTLILYAKKAWECLIFLIAGLSIAPLFGVERGNTDLVVFAIVFCGCFLPKASQRAGMFLLATILKLFPVAALLVAAIRQRGKDRLWTISLLALGVILLAAQWSDLVLIQKGTPAAMAASYGVLSLRETVWLFLIAHDLLGQHAFYATFIAVLLFWISAFLTTVKAWRKPTTLDRTLLESRAADLFLIFATIYISSFAIGSNWDYRLIFLIPTLPFAFELMRRPGRFFWGLFYILGVLLAENCVGFWGGYTSLVAQVVTVTQFFLLLPILVQQMKAYLVTERRSSLPVLAELPLLETPAVPR